MPADEDTEQYRLIRRVLRVNHAGEHGAISIYNAQIRAAQSRCPALTPWLLDTLGHECRHRDAFLAAMPDRNAKPCRAMFVWALGGNALGFVTALFGQYGIMVCTAAVERTVHQHLDEQIEYLSGRDAELATLIQTVKKDEDSHLAYAEAHHNPHSFSARVLAGIVALATEMLIWISTRGDSLRLRASLQAATLHPRPR